MWLEEQSRLPESEMVTIAEDFFCERQGMKKKTKAIKRKRREAKTCKVELGKNLSNVYVKCLFNIIVCGKEQKARTEVARRNHCFRRRMKSAIRQ